MALTPVAQKEETSLATRNEAAIARYNPQDLWPRSWEEAAKLAGFLSKSGLLPKHLQGNEANTFYSIMAGLELGVAPLVACREIYFVDGKPTCSSLLKVALVRGSPLCEKWQELKSTAEECTYVGRRFGDKSDTVRTFTMKDAERAGLTGKDNWKKWPGAMLRRRCQGQLADDLFPDVVKGLGSNDESVAIDPGEVRWAERVTPPPPPGTPPATNGTAPSAAGEEAKEAPAVEAEATDELSLEYLLRNIESATSLEGLQAGTLLVQKAKASGKLTPDDEQRLLQAYKAKRAALNGSAK